MEDLETGCQASPSVTPGTLLMLSSEESLAISVSCLYFWIIHYFS